MNSLKINGAGNLYILSHMHLLVLKFDNIGQAVGAGHRSKETRFETSPYLSNATQPQPLEPLLITIVLI